MRRLALILICLAIGHATTAVADAVARRPVAGSPTSWEAVAGSFIVLCYHEARDDVRDYPDPFAVDSAALVRQFAWLRGNGYTPVSLDQIVAARRGGKPLPAKAVLLTFDDGYLSFYTRVYPLLREFRFPAVLAVVGRWIDNPPGTQMLYGEKDTGTVTEASFPTWSQLREMVDSGLVEIASHTYDLHRGVPSNPQVNLQPAATARIHDAAAGSYEGDAHWRTRVRADLAMSASVIERETGRRPRAIAWPYGSYNDELVRMAGELGMTIALTLEADANTPDVPLAAVRRILVAHNPALADFADQVRGPRYPEPVRALRVSLDEVYSADPAQQERNLSVLLDRVQALKPTHVLLEATADTDGDGIADAAYFPNRHLPLRGDLFSRAAWQLTSRVDVKVFAVVPVTSARLPPAAVAEMYEDLARHAHFAGLVFDEGGIEFTRQLAARASAFRAPLKIVGALRSAQDVSALAAAYDYVMLTAPPGRGDVYEPEVRRKLVYVLPVDKLLAGQMRALQLGRSINFGYGPDDFLHDNPPAARTAPAMSLRTHPLFPGATKK